MKNINNRKLKLKKTQYTKIKGIWIKNEKKYSAIIEIL